MSQEINLGGAIYVSSKRAAEITGYSQDYVGQLARSAAVDAKRISGLWYIREDSIRSHKEKSEAFTPTPPIREASTSPESTVSFDGKDYVSAQRAAKITGYNADYVSQLARTGKVLSRLVGNRWYVDREGIKQHKEHNDSLLAAVQTESVGLSKPVPPQTEPQSEDTHFTYTPGEASRAIPPLQSASIEGAATADNFAEPEEEVKIPIRVIPTPKPSSPSFRESPMRTINVHIEHPRNSIYFLAVCGIAVSVVVALGYMYLAMSPRISLGIQNQRAGTMGTFINKAVNSLQDLLAKNIYYERSR